MARMYDFQLKSGQNGASIRAAGGMALVVSAGLGAKVALTDINGAAVANPSLLTNGRCKFFTSNSQGPVDIYIMTPTGHMVILVDVNSGDRQEVAYNPTAPETMIAIPVLGSDYTAAAEGSTGITLPAGLLINPNIGYMPITAQSSKTADIGILASETGGSANGFMAAIPLSGTTYTAAKSAATATRGSFVGAGTLDRGYPTDGVAKTVSWTPSSGTTTAAGIILLPAFVAPTLFV